MTAPDLRSALEWLRQTIDRHSDECNVLRRASEGGAETDLDSAFGDVMLAFHEEPLRTTPSQPEPGRRRLNTRTVAAAVLDELPEAALPDGYEWAANIAARLDAEIASSQPEPLDVTSLRFRAALDAVFADPGVEFGPAKGYYGPFLDDFIAALAARLLETPQ